MKKTNRLFRTILALGVGITVLGTAGINCFAASDGKVNISLVGKYDSADIASIREVDTENKEIRLRNHSTGKTYTLNYDNTSMMYDTYGTAISPRILEVGEIVDVTFLKSSKHLTTLNISKDAWVIEDTRDHNLVRNDGTALVDGNVYKIDARTLIMADEKLALAEDILSTDSIKVSGIGNDIYSVIVESGHGYVSLSSEVVDNHSLVGAWLELDNEVIHKISPNMLLSAPEGDYKLQILGNGANYQSEVNISRNQETVVDTSDVTIAKPKEGLVTFQIVPDTAEVFVDGTKMLTSVPQSVQYGYHNLKIIADGYVTQTKYLKVGTPKSVISIELEKEETEEESTESNSSDSASSASTASNDAGSESSSEAAPQVSNSIATVQATNAEEISSNSASKTKPQNSVIDGCKIFFDEPYEAEVYFDGTYIGMIPTSIVKITGNHEVIVKKDGYETKSYRIYIDSEETDLKYSFPGLVKINEEKNVVIDDKDNTKTISGNDASDVATTGEKTDAPSDATTGETTQTPASATTEETGDNASEASTGETTNNSGGEESTSTAGTTEEASGVTTSAESGATEGTTASGTAESTAAEDDTSKSNASSSDSTGTTSNVEASESSSASTEETAKDNSGENSSNKEKSDAASTGSASSGE